MNDWSRLAVDPQGIEKLGTEIGTDKRMGFRQRIVRRSASERPKLPAGATSPVGRGQLRLPLDNYLS